MCGGMLYLYSCTSVKLKNENDEIKVVINLNPFYPFEQLIKTLPPIPNRRYKEEKQQSNKRFEGLQEKTNNEVKNNDDN